MIERRSGSMMACSVGRHTTGSTQNQDSVQFGSVIGGTANPFELSFTRWNVSQPDFTNITGCLFGRWSRERKQIDVQIVFPKLMVYLFPALLAKYYLGQFLLRTGSGQSEIIG